MFVNVSDGIRVLYSNPKYIDFGFNKQEKFFVFRDKRLKRFGTPRFSGNAGFVSAIEFSDSTLTTSLRRGLEGF